MYVVLARRYQLLPAQPLNSFFLSFLLFILLVVLPLLLKNRLLHYLVRTRSCSSVVVVQLSKEALKLFKLPTCTLVTTIQFGSSSTKPLVRSLLLLHGEHPLGSLTTTQLFAKKSSSSAFFAALYYYYSLGFATYCCYLSR